MEQTLVFIKPSAKPEEQEQRKKLGLEQILPELDKTGKRSKTSQVEYVPRQVIAEHYGLLDGKSFYPTLVNFYTGKPVLLAIYEGEDIVNKIIEKTGPTLPSKAGPNAIRGKYSKDTYEQADKEKRPLDNVIHRSGSIEEANRELNIWRNYFITTEEIKNSIENVNLDKLLNKWYTTLLLDKIEEQKRCTTLLNKICDVKHDLDTLEVYSPAVKEKLYDTLKNIIQYRNSSLTELICQKQDKIIL